MPPSRVRIPPSPLRLARTDKGKSRSLTVERVRPGNFTPAPLRMTRKPATEAERAGFEPATHLSARTRFPVALLRPLGHLSAGGHRNADYSPKSRTAHIIPTKKRIETKTNQPSLRPGNSGRERGMTIAEMSAN